MASRLHRFWDTLTGKDLPLSGSINNDPTHVHKLPTVKDEKFRLPFVWYIVFGLVLIGLVVNIFLAGGMIVWPFVFAVSLLLLSNDASDRHGVGVPPLQAYALFGGTLAALFLFVALVSTINLWLLGVLLLAGTAYVARDWAQRRSKQRALNLRRLAGLCVRCGTPVKNGLDERCSACGTPVNPERLSLFQLGRAITMKAQPSKARQVLTGRTPTRSDLKMQKLQERRSTRFAPAAKLGSRKK